jgi:peptidyl-prolyl isomerase D
MEHIFVDEADRPTNDIIIFDCGELREGANDGVVNFFKDGDMYPDWPIHLDEKLVENSWWMDVMGSTKAFVMKASRFIFFS